MCTSLEISVLLRRQKPTQWHMFSGLIWGVFTLIILDAMFFPVAGTLFKTCAPWTNAKTVARNLAFKHQQDLKERSLVFLL